jgi:HAD superfamily hydrolase (TIGR01509 family)
MKIECVLFDLDGVLVDACEWHYIALNEALRQIVGFEISREDHISKYNGLPTAVKLRMLGLEAPIALRIEALKQMKTLEIISEKAQIMPEKQELHSYLKSQGIKIACVTNSIHTTATAMLRQTGQINFMDLVVSNEDVSKNKPHPDCYNFAVQKLGVDPSNCLCVEDSPKGIESARASCVPNLWIVQNSTEVNSSNYKKIVI